jgi:rhodanese-related sulfurtransferase
LVNRLNRITAVALEQQLQMEPKPLVLDVRTEKEWDAGHVAGSRNVPLNHLRERLTEIPRDQTIVVHCEGGYRSAIAASLLEQAGRTNVLDLVGGFKAWTASKLPYQTA